MEELIKKYIKSTMRDYNVFDKYLERELSKDFLNKFNSQVSDGENEEDAFDCIKAQIETIVKQNTKKNNRYAFPLLVCIIFLSISVLEFLISLSMTNGVTLILALVLAVGLLVYAIVAPSKHNAFNITIISVLLACWLITLCQMGIFAIQAQTFNNGWFIRNIFPGIMKLSSGANNNRLAFSPNFISSFVMLITTFVFYIKKRKENK